MTLNRAQRAAGAVFDGAGDGASYPTTLPAGYPHLFVRAGADNKVSCVGADIADRSTPQTVSTAAGFHLGDTVQRLIAIYGVRARYSPAPPIGMAPRAGYVVEGPDGNLAFDVDNTNTWIFGIKGGGRDLTPSSCPG